MSEKIPPPLLMPRIVNGQKTDEFIWVELAKIAIGGERRIDAIVTDSFMPTLYLKPEDLMDQIDDPLFVEKWATEQADQDALSICVISVMDNQKFLVMFFARWFNGQTDADDVKTIHRMHIHQHWNKAYERDSRPPYGGMMPGITFSQS